MSPYLVYLGASLLAAAAEEAHETGSPLPKITTVIICFLIVFWVLKKFAFGPLLAVLDERSGQIKKDLERAADLRNQAAAERDEYEQHLRRIEEESRQKMQEMITEGRRISTTIQENAQKQAAAILEKAQQNIQFEMEKARAVLKAEVINLTIQATEHLIQERLDEPKQRELIGDFLTRIERN